MIRNINTIDALKYVRTGNTNVRASETLHD